MRRRRVGFRSAWTAVSRRRAGRCLPGIERIFERLVAAVNLESYSGTVRGAAHADIPATGKTPDRRTRVLFLRAAS
jgi:hypothetical protein